MSLKQGKKSLARQIVYQCPVEGVYNLVNKPLNNTKKVYE